LPSVKEIGGSEMTDKALSIEEQENAILRDCHRRMQVQHGIRNEDGTMIERVRKKPPTPVKSKNPKKYFGEFRSKEKIRSDDR
jgi:hypothetical protein